VVAPTHGTYFIANSWSRVQCFDRSQIQPKIIMKKILLFGLMFSMTGSLLAADSSPVDVVTNAAAALGNQANYSWHAVQASPGGGGGFGGGATDGKTEKDGYTWISMDRGGNITVALLKGTNAAIKSADNGWQTVAEATADNGNGFNPAMFIAMTVQNIKPPAVEAADLAGRAKDLKKDADVISGDLTEDGAKVLLAFRPRGGAGNFPAPEISNAKGSVKFWVTDGKLVKYETHLQGSMSFNGNDRDIDRTTTVEIKDVGTTKLEVPEDAKKKLP
jgi:hypothetical protein